MKKNVISLHYCRFFFSLAKMYYCLCCRHNTHHYLKFFKSIREAIRAGEFDQFRWRFIESRRECDHLALTDDRATATVAVCV